MTHQLFFKAIVGELLLRRVINRGIITGKDS